MTKTQTAARFDSTAPVTGTIVRRYAHCYPGQPVRVVAMGFSLDIITAASANISRSPAQHVRWFDAVLADCQGRDIDAADLANFTRAVEAHRLSS